MSNTQTVQKAKPKPNMTTVTPVGPAVPPPDMDTTTPIDVSIIAFTMRDMPKWGTWLLSRLSEIWPRFSSVNYIGILLPHMGANTSLFIRAKKAILLAIARREEFDPRPIVDIVFCFKHIPDDEVQNKDVRILFRRVEDWAKAMGAKEIRISHPDRCDNTPSRTKEILYGDDVKIFVKDMDR